MVIINNYLFYDNILSTLTMYSLLEIAARTFQCMYITLNATPTWAEGQIFSRIYYGLKAKAVQLQHIAASVWMLKMYSQVD